MFNPTELSTICLFFGVDRSTPPGNSLSEHYFLEESSVEHPIGDKLYAENHGYIVHFAEENSSPWYFQRDFAGLVAALERLTTPVA